VGAHAGGVSLVIFCRCRHSSPANHEPEPTACLCRNSSAVQCSVLYAAWQHACSRLCLATIAGQVIITDGLRVLQDYALNTQVEDTWPGVAGLFQVSVAMICPL